MTDYMYLGPVPSNEDCAQTRDENFTSANRAECMRYGVLMRAVVGEPPPGARFVIKREDGHDFGSYSELAVAFDEHDEAAIDFAYWCEEHAPATWDDTAPHPWPGYSPAPLLTAAPMRERVTPTALP